MNIVIAGAGKFGREVLTLFSGSFNNNGKHKIRGFINNVIENKTIIHNNYSANPLNFDPAICIYSYGK